MEIIKAITVKNLTKSYINKSKKTKVLHGIDFEFEKGLMTAVMGPSGSGKSTFLQCVAGLDKVSGGNVFIGETDITKLSEKELNIIRREKIGFIFQTYNLMSMLTVYDNVVLPLKLAKRKTAKNEIMTILAKVGLHEFVNRYPSQLSGGQQQRVAIARTLATKPDVLFADEPTGALDTSTGKQILSLLRQIVNESKQTIIIVTHDLAVASIADQVVFLIDGQIKNVLKNPTIETIALKTSKWENDNLQCLS